MKFKLSLLLCSLLFLASCAKDLPGGAAGNNTRLNFNMTYAQPINPNFIYVVAIRVLTPPVGTYNTSLSDPAQGPSPVVTTGSKNGIVGGLPTHYVIYVPNYQGLYTLYRFPLSTEAPDPNDPAPINLSWPGQAVGDVLPGAVDPSQGQFGNGTYLNQLGFTIDTSYLSQHVPTGQKISKIQFNIFSMNLAATSSGNVGQRVMDAIGNQSALGGTFNNPITVDITTSNTYTDQTTGVPEPTGDTYPGGSSLPPVDLTSWSLTVQTP